MNPSRRDFLIGAAALVGGSAGCVGSTEERAAGESVSAGGLAVTIEDFFTTSTLKEADMGDDTITPPSGAVFLLVHLVVENNADAQRELPREPELIYSEEEATDADIGITDTFVHEGKEYLVYRFIDAKAVFPGNSVDGWAIYTVPENFQASKAVVEMEIEGGDEDVTGEWTLGE